MTSRRLLDPATRMFLDAADYIEKHGWCQGALEDDSGQVCILAALAMVNDGNVPPLVNDKLRQHLGHPSISGWNDRDGRTKDEVVAALRGAALS